MKFDLARNTWAVLAGGGASGNVDGTGSAAKFTLSRGADLAIDGSGFLYIRSLDTIRKTPPDGIVTTLATGLTTASNAIAVDKQVNVYTAGSQVIYLLSANRSIASYPCTPASDFITSMTKDSAGNLFVGTRGVGAQISKITF